MKSLVILLIVFNFATQAYTQTISLGIITDYKKSEEIDSIFQLITEEISLVAGSSSPIQLIEENIIYDVSSEVRARDSYNQLVSSTDLIILVGSLSIQGSLENDVLPKPTIGIGIIDPYLQDIPYVNGISQVENFSYIWPVKDLKTELIRFKEISSYRNLSILVHEKTVQTINEDRGVEFLDSLEKSIAADIQIIEVTSDISQTLNSLPSNTDAVYLSYLEGKSPGEIRSIADGLITKNLPSFSSAKWHVDNGIMACISDENDLQQVIRKLAIMVDDAINGEPLSEMPVNINFKEDLYINSSTIRALDLGLTFDIYFTANFIDDEQDLPTYNLEEVMEIALQNNFGIKISQQDISLAIQDVKAARTNVLPTLDLGISASQVGSDQANEIFDIPERKATGELVLDQVIYSERAFAGIKITSYLQRAQEYATDAEILEVLLNTYFNYFTVLAAKTNLSIEKENLENFKINLELARIRVGLGSASRAEILRWESEVAAANQRVVDASTNLLISYFQLNTSLANRLEDEFDVEDIGIDDELYQRFTQNAFSPFVNNPDELRIVAEFLVEESTRNNPNKQFLLEQINAVERQKIQNKRVFYIPNLALKAQMGQVLWRDGAASGNSFDIPNNTWNVGVGLAFPIFDAKRRIVDLQTSEIQLDQLANTRMQLDQQLELSVRSALLDVVANSTNISFSKTSADNAVENFELVREKYQAGDISITQLIDAQQTALSAKQRYAVAVYDYIQSQLQLEFTVGFFSMFASPAQLQDFNNRYLEFRNNQ